MLEPLGEDYVRTARGKGATDTRIMRAHVIRNVLLPGVTLLGIDIGLALGGAFLTETVFGLPGPGKLAAWCDRHFDLR